MPTTYASRLAAVAEKEFNDYNPLPETAPKMAARIQKYWIGIAPFPGVGTAWSAVFISFMVKSAGASAAEFLFAQSHSLFVHQAIANFAAGTGVFHGRDVADYAPKVGDIVHNNRSGGTYNYAYAKAHSAYKSHSAIVVEEGIDGSGRYVRTVGGNESNTVDDKIIRVDNAGLIKQPPADPTRYISVIQNLK